MDDGQVIGIDLGGTAIKLARFDPRGALLAELEVATPQPAVPGAVTMALCDAVEQLDPDGAAALVGVGLPASTCRVGRTCRWRSGWRCGCSDASPSPTTAIAL